MQSSYVTKRKTNRMFVNRAENSHYLQRIKQKGALSSVVVVLIKNIDKIKILKQPESIVFNVSLKNVNS